MSDNISKSAPKGNIKFSITLSGEQKLAKAQILHHPYNFIIGKAGSGKTLLAMVLGRLGKGSTMILTGDPQQIDLKFSNDSAIHDVPKVKDSNFVHAITLTDNHRHAALNEVLRLLQSYS